MKLLGEDGVAAITIIIYTQFLLTTLYIGFSMGVAPVISYNYGKRLWLPCGQLSVLRAEHFYFRHIYRIIKREAVGGIVLPADVRADLCASAHPARICGSDGCVAGSTDSRAAYNGGGANLSLS